MVGISISDDTPELANLTTTYRTPETPLGLAMERAIARGGVYKGLGRGLYILANDIKVSIAAPATQEGEGGAEPDAAAAAVTPHGSTSFREAALVLPLLYVMVKVVQLVLHGCLRAANGRYGLHPAAVAALIVLTFNQIMSIPMRAFSPFPVIRFLFTWTGFGTGADSQWFTHLLLLPVVGAWVCSSLLTTLAEYAAFGGPNPATDDSDALADDLDDYRDHCAQHSRWFRWTAMSVHAAAYFFAGVPQPDNVIAFQYCTLPLFIVGLPLMNYARTCLRKPRTAIVVAVPEEPCHEKED